MAFKKGNPPWNKGKKGVMPTPWNKKERNRCFDCKEETGRWDNPLRCRDCFSKWKFQIKTNHPRWKKDRSLVKIGDRKLHDPLQKQWRKDVKDRDEWKCRIADLNCLGKLEAHHILPWSQFPELRYQVKNGITLCHHHHPRRAKDVMELSPFFQGLVAQM